MIPLIIGEISLPELLVQTIKEGKVVSEVRLSKRQAAANTVLDDNLLRVLAENNNRDVDTLSLTSVGLKSDGIRLLNQWDWPRLERLDLSIA